MSLFKFLLPKTVASVCDLDKVAAKLQAVANEQEDHAERLGKSVQALQDMQLKACDEAFRARKIIAGINNLLGL